MTGMSPEVREQAKKDELRFKLVTDIAKQEQLLKQDKQLLELVQELIPVLPEEAKTAEGLELTLEMAEYMVKEKEARLAFFLSMLQKHYPNEYESYERNNRR
jgi:hypothetical protein